MLLAELSLNIVFRALVWTPYYLCRNFSLLSFGEEAEEDEEMTNQVSEVIK